jgi:hypothetical protein
MISSDRSHRLRTYKRALVILVDVLGFRELIKTASADAIYKILKEKDRITIKLPRDLRVFGPSFRRQADYIFSDLIVGVRFLRTNVRPNEVELAFFSSIHEYIRLVGLQQFYLACKGVFVRGGITLGDIYTATGIIFGPALVRAYELESQMARWPVIIFDLNLIEEFKERVRRYEAEQSHKLDFFFLIRRAENGIYFLDYLAAMAYEDSTTGDLDYLLDDHRRALLTALETQSNEAYREKYYFLISYHDSKCEEYGYPGLKIGIRN